VNILTRRAGGRRAGLRLGLVAVATAATLVLAACGGGGNSSSTKGGDTLTIAFPGTISSLALPTNCTIPVLTVAYDALIHITPDGKYAPGIASAWKYSDNNQTFTMTIRSGLKFADGTDLNAQSVVDTLTYYRDNPGLNQGYLKPFTSITAPDATTVVIKMDRPFAGMETLLSGDGECNNGRIISAAGLKDPAAMGTMTYGSGPYVLDKADTVAGDHYAFTPNPNYYDKAKYQHYKKIVVRLISDSNTAFQALQTGQVDVDMVGDANLLDQAKSAGVQIGRGGPWSAALFLFDRTGQSFPALGQLKVRQAINYAIDRTAVAKVMGPTWEPLVQFGLRGNPGYDASLEKTYSYDPAKAKQLLAEAGYPNGFDMTIVDQTATVGAPNSTQAIIQQLAAVGIRAKEVTTQNTGDLVGAIQTKQNASMLFLNLGDINFLGVRNLVSPYSDVLDPFHSSDPDITAAYDAMSTATGSDFDKDAVALNKVVTEKAWYASVAQSDNFIFAKGIKNLGTPTSLNQYDIVSWEPAS
jgi:peptide/nickel transport system substrate-binding protein